MPSIKTVARSRVSIQQASRMADKIINLRTARKRRDREVRETTAAENRVKFGQTKSDKQRAKAINELEARRLDQAKRETGDQNGE